MATAKDTVLDVVAMVEALSHEDRVRILANVLWEVFCDLDEHENMVVIPGRSPDQIEVEALVLGLRQEFFPEVTG